MGCSTPSFEGWEARLRETTESPPIRQPRRPSSRRPRAGSGSNLQAIIDACASGQIDGAIVHVVSDRHDAFALQRAHAAGIAATHLARRDGESRAAYDTRLADVVEAGQADIVVLAGWMRILDELPQPVPRACRQHPPGAPG